MTTDSTVNPPEPTQTDLIRYFDRYLVTAEPHRPIDIFAIRARAQRERSELIGRMIGEGVAWLRQRLTHFGETRSPAVSGYVDRVQF